MKKLLLILLALPFIGFGQQTYVPDNAFEVYLEQNGMGDGIYLNDSVSTANINTVTSLYVISQNIADLTGIEAFTALTELYCGYNNLTSLDLSLNTALTELNCSYNPLTSLDVSQNTALTTLECWYNQLTSLDVSQNTALTFLSCPYNQLDSLNVSLNTALTTLYCIDNQLTSLNVSGASALTTLYCYNNQLTSLDVRNGNNTNFQYFYAYNNPNLYCIDVDDATWSTANWTNIDTWASFSANCVTALGCTDTLAYNYDSTATINDGSCYYGKTYVPDNNFEAYLEVYGMGDGISGNDSVYTANINTVTSLNVSSQNIADLTGIEAFAALTYLGCGSNQLDSLDVSQNTALTTLYCSHNPLTSLNVSQNTALTTLYCEYNQLTSLDVSQNTALSYLACDYNQLTSLDVSNNSALSFFNCSSNQLTTLDLRNHPLTPMAMGGGTGLVTDYNNQLFCIDVDNPSLAQILASNFYIDPWTSFDTNCVTALGCMDSLACNYIPNATIDNGGCTYPPVTLNDDQVICSNFFNATLEVNYNTGSYTYLWSNGETTQSIDSLPMGSYSVIVTDSSGCSTNLNANVTLAPTPAFNMFPEICYVTVDSATGNNKVIVKPMANLLTSKFIIYKESSANIYSPIDTINSNILDYLDVSSNPMAQSYRYKISVLDTCSNESVKSDFHKTIHLTMSLGLNGEVNLLWNNYEGYQPSDYLIFRSVNNGSMNQVGILPGTNLAFTDLTPPSGILNYQVKAVVPTCNIIPFAKQLTNMLASNVINYSTTAVNELVNSKNVIKITDLLGRETKATNQLLFYIYNDGTVEKKVVVE
jgi:Leucine-rich repeat (LRR) protein